MSKIYLQEKIPPVAGKYIIVGHDGNLTTGDLPSGTFPTINITVPVGSTNVQCSKTRGQSQITVPVTQKSSSTYTCNPNEFGTWTVSCRHNGDILSDTVNVALIKSYSITLSDSPSPEYDILDPITISDDIFATPHWIYDDEHNDFYAEISPSNPIQLGEFYMVEYINREQHYETIYTLECVQDLEGNLGLGDPTYTYTTYPFFITIGRFATSVIGTIYHQNNLNISIAIYSMVYSS